MRRVKEPNASSRRSQEPRYIPVDWLHPDLNLSFREMSGLDSEISAMGRSLLSPGQIYPLTVRPQPNVPNSYLIVTGHLRWMSAKQNGIEKLACQVLELNDQEALELYVSENINRVDLNPLEKADLVAALMERCPKKYPDPEAVAVRFGVVRTTLVNWLALRKLPPSLQKLIKMVDYNSLLRARRIPADKQSELATFLETHQLSQRQISRIIELVEQGSSVKLAVQTVMCKPSKTHVRVSVVLDWLHSNLCSRCKEKLPDLEKVLAA